MSSTTIALTFVNAPTKRWRKPDWLIHVTARAVTSFRDLDQLRSFVTNEGAKDVTQAVSGLLGLVEEKLDETDVYVLENNAGDKLHFCRPMFPHQRGYVAAVKARRDGEKA